MANFIRFIGLLMLALALCQTVGDRSADTVADAECFFTDEADATAYQGGDASYTVPQWPCLPDAEFTGISVHTQLLTYSRIQRTHTTAYFFSLKSCVDKLSAYKSALTTHRSRLYNTIVNFPYYSTCDYYIFTLRRILI